MSGVHPAKFVPGIHGSFSCRHSILLRSANCRQLLDECYKLWSMVTFIPSIPSVVVLMIEVLFNLIEVIDRTSESG